MCGIVGYIGNRNSQQILLEGLKKLEYRGYDSAGVAVYTPNGLQIKKSKGRLANLESKLSEQPLTGNVGIGHTRWATHGKPCDENSHPHTDTSLKFSVVHNGIIENYSQLKEVLIGKGHHFVSETDTEVIAHLISEAYEGNIVKAVQQAVKQLRGAYALAVLTEYEPDKLVAVRLASPLVIGVGQGENFIGSDIPAVLEYTRDVIILDDGEMAVLTNDKVELLTIEGNFIVKQMLRVNWDIEAAEKAGYEHFMLKEIYEQPKAYKNTMSTRIIDEPEPHIVFNELKLNPMQLNDIWQIHMVACGTACHAALVGKTVIEKLVRIPVEVCIASEYRYNDPIVTPNTLVIAVSQSGETADTLAAMREAKQRGARVLAITNAVGSSLAREADDVIYTWAGPEISVASTKAYTTQLIALFQFGIYLAQTLETQNKGYIAELIAAVKELPGKVEQILQHTEQIAFIAQQISGYDNLFFIGRGQDYAVAMEGSLKLKEISYIHSEAYAAGELKHGTLALIEEGTPVIALVTQQSLKEKTMSNMKEVKARGAQVIALTLEDHSELGDCADLTLKIPNTMELFTPALSVVPLQLLAYYTAVIRGHDVDKPRNLAKSVTVE